MLYMKVLSIYKFSDQGRLMSEQKLQYKFTGEVYTPSHIVNLILDEVGYSGYNILHQHIIDNSAGAGAFLIEVVRRFVHVANQQNISVENIALGLETYIHGIELSKEGYQLLIKNLDSLVYDLGIRKVEWDIINGDALAIDQFNCQMDFVVGNPPYVRVHNLNESYDNVKTFLFTQTGMTDLYLAFYELGIRMLKQHGRLSYISPSSWWTSLAGVNFRKYLVNKKSIYKLIDLGHYQPFEKITTYTAITFIQKDNVFDYVDFFEFDKSGKHYVDRLDYSDFSIGKEFYFGTKNDLHTFRQIRDYQHFGQPIRVKNGFATLADKTFLNTDSLSSEFVIPVVKATTGEWKKIIYPYDEQGKIIPEETFSTDEAYTRIKENFEQLSKNKPWYGYGRTQAINDVRKFRLSLNSTINNTDLLRLTEVPIGSGVYGGIYIVDFESVDIPRIKEVLYTSDFMAYVKVLRKYRRGGYYTFSSRDVEQFLNYKIRTHDE